MEKIESYNTEEENHWHYFFEPFFLFIRSLREKRNAHEKAIYESRPNIDSTRSSENLKRINQEMVEFYEQQIDRIITLLNRFFKRVKYMSKRLKNARSTAERIVILNNEANMLNQKFETFSSEEKLSYLFPIYAACLHQTFCFYSSVLELEQGGNTNPTISSDCQYPHTPEQVKAYNRVAHLFENQPFWKGSLSGFVSAMDKLALDGNLATNEMDKKLAGTFKHKSNDKSKIKELSSKQINNRRRNMKYGRYSTSNELERTMDDIRRS